MVVDPDAEQNIVFLLPRWPIGRTVGAKMAQWWLPPANGDESRPLTLEETEHFILGTEEILIKNLRRAIADAHRFALVDQANVVITTSSPSDTGVITANVSQYGRTRPAIHTRSDERSFRLGVIFKAIESRKKGLEYCCFLRDNGLSTPKTWQLEGCDQNYVLVYQDVRKKSRKHRVLIFKEKSRSGALRCKLERENPAELRRILATANRTPPNGSTTRSELQDLVANEPVGDILLGLGTKWKCWCDAWRLVSHAWAS